MVIQPEFRPVQRFEFSTAEEAEAEQFIRQAYVGNRTWFHGDGDGARFSAAGAEAGGIAADRIRSTVHYSAVCDPLPFYVFLTIKNGLLRFSRGRDETAVPAGNSTVYPVGAEMDYDFLDVDMHILRLPLERMAAVAQETAGINPGDLRIQAVTPVSPAMAHQWQAFTDLASGMLLAADSPAAHPLLAEELARTAVTALHTFPNTAMTVSYQPGPGWTPPPSVRRAAGYIDAHASQPLTEGQIAAAAGGSSRALREAFLRYYDVTPLGYLRRARLERAHAELLGAVPGSGATVTAVAHWWGWASPSRFAADYRQRFGVPPSHTLRT